MKSLLVDVLRQANNDSPERTLSDSGSFDATQSEFQETANDAVIEELDEASEALELYETSVSLDATFDEAREDAEFPAVGEPLKPTSYAPLPIAENRGPRIARFAPVACIALAAFAAASWSGFQYFKLKYAESEFAIAEMGSRVEHTADMNGSDTPPATERFPFINAAAAVRDAESVK